MANIYDIQSVQCNIYLSQILADNFNSVKLSIQSFHIDHTQ